MRSFLLLALLSLHDIVAASYQARNMTGDVNDVTCGILEAAGLGVYRPNSPSYVAREEDYYSASARMSPTCIIQPRSAQEVSLAVKTLLSTTTNWAVRCGGHTAWGPSADIHDGVTIDLGLMNQTEYDTETQVAKIQGGSLWSDVYSTLEKFGASATGGRTSTVGVGGFLLGGGNNFWSGEKGFGCDNVVNYEVVLTNGDIINANATENPDLWKALKGGSSNFGIVTRFDLQAFQTGDLYGGLVTHPLNATSQLISAFSNFLNNIENYQYGHAFTFWSWVKGATESVIISALYDTTNTANASAFAEYVAVEPVLSSSLRHDSVLNLTIELDFAKGFQNVWFAITVKNDPEILQFIVDQHNNFTTEWQKATGDESFSLYTVFQALPKILFDHGVEQGGNVLGMDRETGNSVLFQVFMVFSGTELVAQANSFMQSYRNTVKEQSIKTGTDVPFEYLNYADKSQDPIKSYGEENVAFLRNVSEKYDPDGIQQTRVPGGFKLSKA